MYILKIPGYWYKLTTEELHWWKLTYNGRAYKTHRYMQCTTVYVHVHVHFWELKIGPSVIGMMQGLSACYMACNALILFGCCSKELHEALSSKLHQ